MSEKEILFYREGNLYEDIERDGEIDIYIKREGNRERKRDKMRQRANERAQEIKKEKKKERKRGREIASNGARLKKCDRKSNWLE